MLTVASITPQNKRRGWVGLTAIFLLEICGFLLYRLWRSGPVPGWIQTLLFFSYTIMGFLLLLFFIYLLIDLARLLRTCPVYLKRLLKPKNVKTGSTQGKNFFNPSRRQFLNYSASFGPPIISACLNGVGFAEAHRSPRVRRVKLTLDNLPKQFEGFTIAQISDLHIGPTLKGNFVEQVVETVNTLAADILVLTGDMADGQVEYTLPYLRSLQRIKTLDGCFWITGNHEYYWDAESWSRAATSLGFTVLLNRHRVITRKGARIVIAGVTDYNAGRFIPSQRSDPQAALAGSRPSDVKIMLAHQPRSCRAARQAGANLLLCGHTHGGQFFPWHLLVKIQQGFLAGLYQFQGMPVYVNRGTGYWGPPLRLAAPSEISLFTLTRKS